MRRLLHTNDSCAAALRADENQELAEVAERAREESRATNHQHQQLDLACVTCCSVSLLALHVTCRSFTFTALHTASACLYDILHVAWCDPVCLTSRFRLLALHVTAASCLHEMSQLRLHRITSCMSHGVILLSLHVTVSACMRRMSQLHLVCIAGCSFSLLALHVGVSACS